MHLLLPFACFACLFATCAARSVPITFENKCPTRLSVTGHRGESGTEPKLTICADLQPYKQCNYMATADHYQFFADHAWRTTASFIFDSRWDELLSATDTMQIDIKNGFDHPMRITSTKTTEIITCYAKNKCNQTPNVLNIGGAFTVSFCPAPIKK